MSGSAMRKTARHKSIMAFGTMALPKNKYPPKLGQLSWIFHTDIIPNFTTNIKKRQKRISDESIIKILYLAVQQAEKHRKKPVYTD